MPASHLIPAEYREIVRAEVAMWPTLTPEQLSVIVRAFADARGGERP